MIVIIQLSAKTTMVTCHHEGCRKRPNFNSEGETKALYCAEHKSPEMINVKDKTCQSEWCTTINDGRNDGYCIHCYMHLFPDKPITRNYKTKELTVVSHITEKFPDYDWITDKTIINGCSRRRPDLLVDLGYQLVILEIDEDQHDVYDCSCDHKRAMELSRDVGHRNIVFIRFNPDGYNDSGKKITSCWGTNGNGICVVKKEKEWSVRLEALSEQICYWLHPDHKTAKTVEVIQLYFNR
jgi:hypothetical protein